MTVWTNGCFDVIHAGHIALFEYAKSLGDRLIVGLDTDDRVKLNKGLSRPIHTLEQRSRVISSLKFVDKVVSFSSDDELFERIKQEKASLIVVGNDYVGKRVIGSEVAAVCFFSRIPDLSTTRIVNANSVRS